MSPTPAQRVCVNGRARGAEEENEDVAGSGGPT